MIYPKKETEDGRERVFHYVTRERRIGRKDQQSIARCRSQANARLVQRALVRLEATEPLKFWNVRAMVEVDGDGSQEEFVYLVIAKDEHDAEAKVAKVFWDEHPHDLCRKNRPHVGLDTVIKGSAKAIRMNNPGVLAGFELQDAGYWGL